MKKFLPSPPTGAYYDAVLTDVLDAFAPVVNSGSAVLVVAFVAGVFVYRWLRNRKKKE